MKLAIFNEFFQENISVDEIRKLGLSQLENKNLVNDEVKNYPGVRSKDIVNIDDEIPKYIASKIGGAVSQLCDSENIKIKGAYDLHSYYHLTTSIHELGLIHTDARQSHFSGVIYLNPTPEKNSGTNIYIPKKEVVREISFLKNFENANTTQDEKIISSFCREKIKYNESNFEVDYVIPNEYNKCILYPAHYWHSPDRYFGQGLDDSRFCITFFLTFVD
jgi:hypothetical protein